MPKFFVKTEQIKESKIIINGSDVNHIKNVLRAKINDEIEICDYIASRNYICKIDKYENQYIECKIIKEYDSQVESHILVSVFQALPKSDKMELIIQKSVELGVFDITPVEMKRCIVKLNEKDKYKKIERWKKISEVAAKQCGRNIIPNINKIIDINELCKEINKYDLCIITYENEKENNIKQELLKLKEKISDKKENVTIAVIIGPEGGFEEEDVELLKQNGSRSVTLGRRILRTETVALNVLSIIMYELDQ